MSEHARTMFLPIKYLHEVFQELQKVTWPSRKQTMEKTGLVVAVSITVGAYIGLLDYVYKELMAFILK